MWLRRENFLLPSQYHKFCPHYAERLSYFPFFQKVYIEILQNYTKIMLRGFRIFKNVPSVSESSDCFQES